MLRAAGTGLVAIGALVCVWEATRWAFDLSPWVLPSFASVVEAGISLRVQLLRASVVTGLEAAAGLALGTGIGVLLGAGMAATEVSRRWLPPALVAVDAAPKIALAPLLIVWFGTGVQSKVVLATLMAAYPVAVATAQGLSGLDESLELLLRTSGAPRWRSWSAVRIPACVPAVLTGARIAAPAAIVGAVVGEFVSSSDGLGYVLLGGMRDLNMSVALAALFSMCAISIGLYGVVLGAEAWWHR